MQICAVALLFGFCAFTAFANEAPTKSGTNKVDALSETVFEKGEPAGNQMFTGAVWVKMLHSDEEKGFDTQVYNVTFDPSARTYWHSHPGGQILLITAGIGYYQEKGKPARLLHPGDIVAIPANVSHWHGAAPETGMTHLGMSTQVHKGPAEWFGPVTEAEYQQATAQ